MPHDIETSVDLGAAIHARRKELGFTQEMLAAAAGVNPRFLRELEHGKPTAEVGKALQVVAAVGLRLEAHHA